MDTKTYMADVALMSFGQNEAHAGLRETVLLDELASAGFNVMMCDNTHDLFAVLTPRKPYLVLIEGEGSAQMDACTLSAILHSAFHLRIVMIVGDQPGDRVRALNCGADVCLPHPVSVPELIAVLNALQRRMRSPHSDLLGHGRSQEIASDTNIWVLAGRGWILRAPNGAVARLTSIERVFMQQLFQAPAKLLRRSEWDDLCTSMELPDKKGARRNMNAMISRLRRKISLTQVDFPLSSRRGIGYQFAGEAAIDERHHAFEREIAGTP